MKLNLIHSLSAVLVLSLVSVNYAEKARYDNYRVYEVLIETSEQFELLKDIDDYGVSAKIVKVKIISYVLILV